MKWSGFIFVIGVVLYGNFVQADVLTLADNEIAQLSPGTHEYDFLELGHNSTVFREVFYGVD